MKSWKQIVVSLLLVVAAIAVVFPQLNDSEAAQDPTAMEGHDHAAMTAGREAQPVRLDREAARRIGVTMATVDHQALELDIEAVGTVAREHVELHERALIEQQVHTLSRRQLSSGVLLLDRRLGPGVSGAHHNHVEVVGTTHTLHCGCWLPPVKPHA